MTLTDRLPAYKVTLHITHNEHKSYYESAEDYLSRPEGIGAGGFHPDEWVSKADFDTAISADSIWEIQWYPNNPGGSCTAYGSTLENALTAANKEE
jgi:hypothetical protein